MSLSLKHHQKRIKFHSVSSILMHDPRKPTLSELEKQQLKKYELSIDQFNRSQNPQLFDMNPYSIKTPIISDYNRIWKEFCNKCLQMSQKVQKQRVRYRQNIIKQLLDESQKQFKSIQTGIEQRTKLISKKYKQTHNLYSQIHQVKSNIRGFDSNAIRQSQNNKKNTLKSQIQSMLQEIKNIEQEKQANQQKLRIISSQIKYFLKKLLKEGQYDDNGVNWVLQILAKKHIMLSDEDMPTVLDQKSKKLLLSQYNKLCKKITENRRQKRSSLPPIKDLKSFSTTQVLTKKSGLREIYQQAKSIVGQYVKNRNKHQKIKRRMFAQNIDQDESKDWQLVEKKRIKSLYQKDKGQIACKILFGTKLESEKLLPC